MLKAARQLLITINIAFDYNNNYYLKSASCTATLALALISMEIIVSHFLCLSLDICTFHCRISLTHLCILFVVLFVFLAQVSTSTGVISHFVNLQVVVPEAFILGSGELHVDMGSTINLVCIIEKVSAFPKLWQKLCRLRRVDLKRNTETCTIQEL